jgi:hypothetical protein
MGRTGLGDLYWYPGRVDTFATPFKIGPGWNTYRFVVSPGDLTGDRRADVLGVTSTGDAWLYKGTGTGRLLSRVLVARGWSAYTDLLTPGDWTGDRKPDVLARKANGELWLLTGNGTGGFSGARQIGTGWQMYAQMITPGDVTGDGKVDLMGRTPAGALWLYRGTGTTAGTAIGYERGTVLSTGWQGFNTVFSTGDVTGDGRADLVARNPLNANYVYAGTGKGTFAAAKRITAPWGDTTRIFGVR